MQVLVTKLAAQHGVALANVKGLSRELDVGVDRRGLPVHNGVRVAGPFASSVLTARIGKLNSGALNRQHRVEACRSPWVAGGRSAFAGASFWVVWATEVALVGRRREARRDSLVDVRLVGVAGLGEGRRSAEIPSDLHSPS